MKLKHKYKKNELAMRRPRKTNNKNVDIRSGH